MIDADPGTGPGGDDDDDASRRGDRAFVKGDGNCNCESPGGGRACDDDEGVTDGGFGSCNPLIQG